VNEIVNTIKGLSKKVEESMIVQKVLRSLHLKFYAKVSSIEEIKDLDSLTMDELHGILMAYEMRIEKENPSNKEANLKSSKKTKKKEHESRDNFDNESYVMEAHFVRKLKKGSRKYKGKIPFKCFNCGKVVHFVDKCPYSKDESSDDEEYHNVKKGSKYHQHKNNHKQDNHEKMKKYYK